MVNLARVLVRRKGQVMRRCKCCGHDVDYSTNECCKAKRQKRGQKVRVG